MDRFIAEVIEDYVRQRRIDPATGADSPKRLAAEEMVEIVHAYLV